MMAFGLSGSGMFRSKVQLQADLRAFDLENQGYLAAGMRSQRCRRAVGRAPLHPKAHYSSR